jgi:membrane-associated protease RseP (regulator of RpoE activity)
MGRLGDGVRLQPSLDKRPVVQETNESEGAMAGDMRELKIQIEPQADADAEELASLATQLRRELDALDVQSVQLERAGEVPEGAKAVEVLALGSLIVKLGPVAVGVIARVVQGWLKRSAARSAELQIDGDVIKLTGTSLQDQERLIALLEAKHGRR